jgi:hypothetical protein
VSNTRFEYDGPVVLSVDDMHEILTLGITAYDQPDLSQRVTELVEKSVDLQWDGDGWFPDRALARMKITVEILDPAEPKELAS